MDKRLPLDGQKASPLSARAVIESESFLRTVAAEPVRTRNLKHDGRLKTRARTAVLSVHPRRRLRLSCALVIIDHPVDVPATLPNSNLRYQDALNWGFR